MINYQSKFLCKHSDVLKHLIQIPLELSQCERFIKIIILEALFKVWNEQNNLHMPAAGTMPVALMRCANDLPCVSICIYSR